MYVMSQDRVETLLKRHEYSRVIDGIRPIPERERAPWQNFALAVALCEKVDFLTPVRRAELQEARHLLEVSKPRAAATEAVETWRTLRWKVCYQLEDYTAVSNIMGDVPFLKQLFKEYQKRPQGTTSFAVRTQKAWQAFEKAEETLYWQVSHSMEDRKVRDKFVQFMRNILNKAFGEAYWRWCEGERPWILLTVERSKTLALMEDYFVRHMPESVKKHWDFYVGIEAPTPEARDEMRETYPGNIPVELVPAGDGRFTLELYSRRLSDELDEKGSGYFVTDMISTHLGDAVTLALVKNVAINSKAPGKKVKTVPLADVWTALRSISPLDLEDTEALRTCRYPFAGPTEQKLFEGYPGRIWRSDCIEGTTIDLTLQEEYYTLKQATCDIVEAGGAHAGFVVFPKEGSPRAEELMRELEAELDREAGVVLGEAEGTQFGYLDLLAWDLKAVQKTAAELLQRHGLPWACWHSFHYLDRTAVLFES